MPASYHGGTWLSHGFTMACTCGLLCQWMVAVQMILCGSQDLKIQELINKCVWVCVCFFFHCASFFTALLRAFRWTVWFLCLCRFGIFQVTISCSCGQWGHCHGKVCVSVAAMASVVTGLQQIPGRHPGDRAMLPVYSLCHPLSGQKLCHSPHPSSHTGMVEFTSPHMPSVSASTK